MFSNLKLQIEKGTPEYKAAMSTLTYASTNGNITTFYVFDRRNLIAYRKARLATYS